MACGAGGETQSFLNNNLMARPVRGTGWGRPKKIRESKHSMASALYQSIELLSREKGIEPQIVVGAVEEAIALATRKYYKTQENMRGELNKDTGEITAYIFKTVVADEELLEDPVNQITLAEANEL